MRKAGSWRRSLTVVCLICQLGWTAGLSAQAPGETPAPPAHTATALDAEPADREELVRRVQGLEGKLRDSASARKAADQARMEAERHLAEQMQAVERLTAELAQLQAAQVEWVKRLDEREAALSAVTAAYEVLRRQVPVAEGGTLTLDEVRHAAAQALAELRQARRGAAGVSDPAAERGIAEHEATLRRRQFSVALITEAQSVYRVRPNDSLALISSRCYGTNRQWQLLYEANRHLLADPDQLTPGMTLVVP